MRRLAPDALVEWTAQGRRAGTTTAATLFVDISGFTPLTSALIAHGRRGAAELAASLRHYFDPIVDEVHRAGGFVARFAGDALTSIIEDDDGGAAARALAASERMLAFFEENPSYTTPWGAFGFALKVGAGYGEVRWGAVETSEDRVVPWFLGPAIRGCAAAEQRARPRSLVLADGFPSVWPMPGHRALVEPPASTQRFAPRGTAGFPPEGEFRQVATAFLSFDGAEADPGALVRALDDLVARYSGTWNGPDFADKGGVAAIHFGAAASRGDEAERAVDLVLALRNVAPAGVRLRAGLTFDRQYAGFNGSSRRQEFTCLGSGTNLAARLATAAPWGEVWADERLREATRDRYRWVTRGPQRLKGFASPVVVRSLTASRPRADHGSGILHGRDQDRARLETFLEPVLRGQPGGLARVAGPAGIGKSSLIGAVRTAFVERGARWITSQADPAQQRPWFALERVLQDHVGRQGTLPDLLGLTSDRDWRGRTEAGRVERTVEAVVAWLASEATGRGLVLHIDLAHVLDRDTVAVIRRLLAGDTPAGVVLSCRDPADLPSLALGRSLDLLLGPLDATAIHALAVQQLGGRVAPGFVAQIAERSAGNPFLATELLRFLRRRGDLHATPAGWDGDASALPVGAANALLMGALDALPASTRLAVQLAAVLGPTRDRPTLEALADEVGGADVDDAFRVGVFESGNALAFRQPMLGQAAYAIAAPETGRRWHEAAARVLERDPRGAGERIRHLLLAGDQPAAEALAGHAIGAARSEGRETEAAALLRVLVAYAPRESAGIARAELDLSEIIVRAGRTRDAIDVVRRAAARAERLGDAALFARSNRALASHSLQVDAIDDALAAAARAGPGILLNIKANLAKRKGNWPAARALYTELQGYDTDRHLALRGLASCALQEGDADTAVVMLTACLDLGSGEDRAVARANLARALYSAGDEAGAEANMGEAMAACERLGLFRLEAQAALALVTFAANRGDDERAFAHLERAARLAARSDDTRLQITVAEAQASAAFARDDRWASRRYREELLASHDRGLHDFAMAQTRLQLAYLNRLEGWLDDAVQQLELGHDLAIRGGNTVFRQRFEVELGHMALARDEDPEPWIASLDAQAPTNSLVRFEIRELKAAWEAWKQGLPLVAGELGAALPVGQTTCAVTVIPVIGDARQAARRLRAELSLTDVHVASLEPLVAQFRTATEGLAWAVRASELLPYTLRVGVAGGPDPDTRAARALAAARAAYVGNVLATADTGAIGRLTDTGFHEVHTPTSDTPIHLPPTITEEHEGAVGLIGRSVDLARSLELLDAGARVLTITGPEGVGRSTLASAVVEARAGAMAARAWRCALGDARALDDVCVGVAAVLRVPLDRTDPVDRLGTAIRGRGPVTLLFEDLHGTAPGVAAAVARWVEAAPEARFVATSHQPLGISSERHLSLAPLPLPQAGDDPATILATPSGALYARCRAGAGAPVQDDEADDVARLCILLDGRPLAVRVVASTAVDATAAIHGLRHTFQALDAELRQHPDAPLRAGLAWVSRHLSSELRHAWAQLGVFREGIDIDAATAVMGADAAPVLAALTRASLLSVDPMPRMSRSVLEFALGQLEPEGRRLAERRHAEWFARFGDDDALAALVRPGGGRLQRALLAQLPELAAAVERGLALGLPDVAGRACLAALTVLHSAGPFGITPRLAGSVLSAPALSRELRAEILLAHVDILRRSRAFDEAERMLATRVDLPNTRLAARFSVSRAVLDYVLDRDLDAARDRLVNAQAVDPTDLRLSGTVEIHLGNIAHGTGNPDAAAAHYRRARELLAGFPILEATAMANLARVVRNQDDLDQAEELFLGALDILHEWGDLRQEATVLGGLGVVAGQRGDAVAADGFLSRALRLHQMVGDRRMEASTLLNLANLAHREGDPDEAVRRGGQAVAILDAIGDEDSASRARAFVRSVRADA